MDRHAVLACRAIAVDLRIQVSSLYVARSDAWRQAVDDSPASR